MLRLPLNYLSPSQLLNMLLLQRFPKCKCMALSYLFLTMLSRCRIPLSKLFHRYHLHLH